MGANSKALAAALTAAVLLCPALADARGGGGHSGGHSSGHSSSGHSSSGRASHASSSHASHHGGGHAKAQGVQRNSHGKIARSVKAKDSFKHSHPCPSTGKRSGACPGYVIDHVVALERGGADAPGNMEWQTTAAAKAKDRTE